MKYSNILTPIIATSLAFVAGFIVGACAGMDLYKGKAVMHQAGRWVIDDQSKGTTRFEWINPEVEK